MYDLFYYSNINKQVFSKKYFNFVEIYDNSNKSENTSIKSESSSIKSENNSITSENTSFKSYNEIDLIQFYKNIKNYWEKN